jgi:glycosyltransferase involved in cell wall biosynthesis
MPKVSILIANYNNERFLSACLDSLLSQTFSDFEAVVIDDASTDSSREILTGYQSRDSRVRPVFLPINVGVSGVRAIALSHCQGEYIAILDADDTSPPDRLLHQVRFLDEHPDVVLIGGDYGVIDEAGHVVRPRKRVPVSNTEIRWWLGVGNCLIHSTIMFRQAVAVGIGGYDERIVCSEDMDFFSRMADAGEVAALPEVTAMWRTHPGSYTKQKEERMLRYAVLSLGQTIIRRLGRSVSPETVTAMYYNTRIPALNPAFLREALQVLRDMLNREMMNARSDSERSLLHRCALRTLLRIRHRNRRQHWYPETRKEIETTIRQHARKCAWLWDSKLTPRNRLFLLKLLLG